MDKALAADLPEDERYFGLDNFGNTCYCNSVLQALYFCEPFRKAVLDYHQMRVGGSGAIGGMNGAMGLGANGDKEKVNGNGTMGNAGNAPHAPSNPNADRVVGDGVLGNASTSVFMNAVKGVGGKISSHHRTNSSSANTTTAAGAGATTTTMQSSSTGAATASLPPSSKQNANDNTNTASHAGISQSTPSMGQEENMLTALTDLFVQISTQKKRTGSLAPKAFIATLRKENDLFSGFMHQDAHEFLNFVLNDISECLQKEMIERKRRKLGLPPRKLDQVRVFSNSNIAGMANNSSTHGGNAAAVEGAENEPLPRTFVQELFEGKLTNEVRCLCCERVTKREETFLDLSIDVEQNSSLTACLKKFTCTEILRGEEKFFCDFCGTLQEAERRMRVNRLPNILALHLKRFKFIESVQKFKKLSYRVVFPLELRLGRSMSCEDPSGNSGGNLEVYEANGNGGDAHLPNTSQHGSAGASNNSRLYTLAGVIVHVGSGPNHGHYVALIKSHGQWLLFDDDAVEPKDEFEIENVFGLTHDVNSSTETGYILFYQAK